MKIPVVINGIDVVKDIIIAAMNEVDMTGKSEEYQKGFYEFGNAMIDTLNKVLEEGSVSRRSGS